MKKHHLFSLEVCVHSPMDAKYIRARLNEIREAIGDHADTHVFRMSETQQCINEENGIEEESDALQSAVHMAS